MFILRIQMEKLRHREQQRMHDVVEERGATLHLNSLCVCAQLLSHV